MARSIDRKIVKSLIGIIAVVLLCMLISLIWSPSEVGTGIGDGEIRVQRLDRTIESGDTIASPTKSSRVEEADASRSSPTKSREPIGEVLQAVAEVNAAGSGGQLDAQGVADHSRRGKEFSLSRSLQKSCNAKLATPLGTCERMLELLEMFRDENVDTEWADFSQRALKALVEKQAGFNVRTVECRTSLCFLEVSSQFGVFHGGGYRFEKETHITSGTTIFAYETNRDGDRITVTLVSYRRS